MGLFSRKPKAPDFDPAECQRIKEKLRQMFNEAVPDGDTYRLIEGYSSTDKIQRGIYIDKHTTTFYHYIIGYREQDWRVVLVQIDRALSAHSDAICLDMDAVVDVDYIPKTQNAALVYEKGYGSYGELLHVVDYGRKTAAGIANLNQAAEREDFLNFLEKFRAVLSQKGYKLSKWTR
ncbi:hypothetical protein [uncultured Pseudoflavonifractor sp.]|uniref:hypothetical protein n=1 Tax=uncultured Pseudoflavonifractor sp. TaxID=1221379 RepID=UPI0025D7A2A0|nr:hypothetical protein [uncultured Pseudoflavonifractor sp.]